MMETLPQHIAHRFSGQTRHLYASNLHRHGKKMVAPANERANC